jgi:lysophospholipase L1-like esterase
MKYTYLKLLAAASVFTACKPNIEGIAPSRGGADFTSYTAIGNSLTAGYADGTLYRSGQINSYPNMLAGQFSLVGGGAFKQPLLPGEAGWPSPKRVLGISTGCDGVTGLGPVLYSGPSDTATSLDNISAQGPFNNLGVPGIRAIDYTVAGYAFGALALGGVGYAYRMYPNPMTDRPIDIAAKSNHTFFTMWLGNNDVLGYATAGGEGIVGGTRTIDISPTTAFQASYKAVVDVMTAKGQKGVLINLPDVASTPFFTTIPVNGLLLARQGQADSLNQAYAPLGIKFNVGPNYFIVQDETVPGGRRQLKNGEYLLLTLPQDSIKCGGWGSRVPIPRRFVLDAREATNVMTATQSFNSFIQQLATTKGLAYVDMNSYLKTLQSGIRYNGVTYGPTFVTGGAFSLDGIHLTPRGYALAANQILAAINLKYGATLPQLDVNKYDGVRFP